MSATAADSTDGVVGGVLDIYVVFHEKKPLDARTLGDATEFSVLSLLFNILSRGLASIRIQ